MDGTSSFPSRPEMEAQPADVRRADRDPDPPRRAAGRRPAARGDRSSSRRPTASTAASTRSSRSASRSRGRPDSPGMDLVAHYADTRPADTYAGRRIFIIGKQNSGFELASGLLQWARGIVLASPSPAKLSVNTNSLAGIRARYLQPYEDHAIGGGVGDPQRRDRAGRARRATCSGSRSAAPTLRRSSRSRPTRSSRRPASRRRCRTCSALGVATFGQSKLPALTPFWESATVPGHLLRGHDRAGVGGPEEARPAGELRRGPRRALQRPHDGAAHRVDALRRGAAAAGGQARGRAAVPPRRADHGPGGLASAVLPRARAVRRRLEGHPRRGHPAPGRLPGRRARRTRSRRPSRRTARPRSIRRSTSAATAWSASTS